MRPYPVSAVLELGLRLHAIAPVQEMFSSIETGSHYVDHMGLILTQQGVISRVCSI